jgi:hypothetical protein
MTWLPDFFGSALLILISANTAGWVVEKEPKNYSLKSTAGKP